MFTKYRKIPVEIDVVLWDGTSESLVEIKKLTDKVIVQVGQNLVIPTLENDMLASLGDYIIRGVIGEVYPCKPEAFHLTYEKV